MNIWPLGVGGWIPAFGRQTNATLIEYKNKLILIDAGTGLSSLTDYGVILSQYDEINLILTHYHMDHIMGLFFLPKYLKEKKLNIFGPGMPYYPQSCEESIRQSLMQPYGTTGHETLAKEVYCYDYTVEGFELGHVNVKITPQNHTLPSFGITIDDKVHIATDTDVNPEVFKLDVKLLLHECWAFDDESAQEHASMEALTKAYFSQKENCKIDAIGLIHRNPSYSDTEYAGWTRKPFFLSHMKIK